MVRHRVGDAVPARKEKKAMWIANRKLPTAPSWRRLRLTLTSSTKDNSSSRPRTRQQRNHFPRRGPLRTGQQLQWRVRAFCFRGVRRCCEYVVWFFSIHMFPVSLWCAFVIRQFDHLAALLSHYLLTHIPPLRNEARHKLTWNRHVKVIKTPRDDTVCQYRGIGAAPSKSAALGRRAQLKEQPANRQACHLAHTLPLWLGQKLVDIDLLRLSAEAVRRFGEAAVAVPDARRNKNETLLFPGSPCRGGTAAEDDGMEGTRRPGRKLARAWPKTFTQHPNTRKNLERLLDYIHARCSTGTGLAKKLRGVRVPLGDPIRTSALVTYRCGRCDIKSATNLRLHIASC